MCFHAELALYGKFWEVPERLFFRRMHDGASFGMNEAQRRAFYDPAGRKRHGHPQWQHLTHYFQSVKRAPVSVGERLRLLRMVSRIFMMQRRELMAELAPTLSLHGAARGTR
jgi:hypothetical protein